ncbi:histidine utilization repressor [Pandoraea sp. PE-S2T-3]|uniref:histidine utilization repressor n=1 Tax=Pandoraea sp. PE-S2T-3 TaxID=1986993 RepID=UPI000B406DE6
MPPSKSNANTVPTSFTSGKPSALYQQVRNYIEGKIAAKEWVPGDRVPSEQELVELFGISRMTVNRALRELAKEGRVERVAGVGTFVAEPRPQSTLLHIANIAEEIRRRGHRYQCHVISVESVPATPEIAGAMGLPTGQLIAHSICVHLENEVPVQLEDRYVNQFMAPDFVNQTFTNETPAAFLLRAVPVDEIEHIVDATLPTKKQASLLQMEPTQPCLVLFRRTWTKGKVVTMVRCYHPANRYVLGSRFPADSGTR